MLSALSRVYVVLSGFTGLQDIHNEHNVFLDVLEARNIYKHGIHGMKLCN